MTKPALAPIVEEIPAGVLWAQLPTPFPVGPVNCFLLPEDPVTLVDPGMVMPESIALLEGLLASAGLQMAEVRQIFVTHGHPDHYGAAGWVAERSGAKILCGEAERPKLLNQLRPAYLELLTELGLPANVSETFPTLREATRELIQTPEPASLRHPADGDRLAAGGRQWTVIETPGHAAGHISLWDPDAGVLFSGDHLLPKITPNPALELDEETLGWRRSLIEYLESLPRFIVLDPSVVLPGHGPAFTDVAQLVERMRSHHVDRAERVLALVAEMGSPTPYEVAMRLFPFLEGFGVLLGVSEAIGHLDLLVVEGRIRQVDGSPARFTIGPGGS